jgi:hypothetical protein
MGLGSGIRKKPIPDPGPRGQKGTGSRIRNTVKMANLSFSSSGLLSVIRRKGVSISIFSSSYLLFHHFVHEESSFLKKHKIVDFFDV